MMYLLGTLSAWLNIRDKIAAIPDDEDTDELEKVEEEQLEMLESTLKIQIYPPPGTNITGTHVNWSRRNQLAVVSEGNYPIGIIVLRPPFRYWAFSTDAYLGVYGDELTARKAIVHMRFK